MESTRSNNKGFSSKGALVPSMVWRLLVSGAMALVFLVVDQVSKMIVRRAVMTGFFSVEVIPGVLGLEFVANRGAAFGLGEGMGWVFVLLAVGVTAFVLVYLLRAPKISRLEVLGMGMVVGGAIGNAIDRLVFGFVTDFFATRFIDFPFSMWRISVSRAAWRLRSSALCSSRPPRASTTITTCRLVLKTGVIANGNGCPLPC